VFKQKIFSNTYDSWVLKDSQLIARSRVMFAVFQSGGKQHRVAEGDVVRLEKLCAEPGEEIVFDKVLLVSNGDDVNVGAPYVESGRVTGEVMRTDRGKKIRIIKFKRRKDFLKRQGHRQWFTEVKITGISS
jgi:large subunit ribosomal protein L21